MSFVGKISKKESSSQAYNKVGMDLATHLKVKGESKFIEISDGLIIKRKGAQEGQYEDVHYSEIADGGQYVCVIGEDTLEIESDFYAQVAFMVKSEDGNGTHLRCDPYRDKRGRILHDGIYVRRDEIQIPAYREVEVAEGHVVLDKSDTIHGGKFYAYNGSVILKDGRKVYLPNPKVIRANLKWYYIREDGKREECASYNADDRAVVNHVLVNGEKIVHVSKIHEKDGRYVIDGEEEEIGERKIALGRPFIQGETQVGVEQHFTPKNIDRQHDGLVGGDSNLIYTWAEEHPGEDGVVRIEINKSKTIAKFFYKDGSSKAYVKKGSRIPRGFENSVIRVDGFDIEEDGDDGIKFITPTTKSSIAQDIEFKNGKVNSYTLNGKPISDIEWSENDKGEYISSYTINQFTISNIEWVNGKIKGCVITETRPEGEQVDFIAEDIHTSRFSSLAITYDPITQIEDVEVDDGGKFSFKLGEYTLKDVEINDDGSVGRCIIVKDGVDREVDLSEDEEFKQLRLAVNIVFNEQIVTPLVESNLLEKRDGKYVVVKDLVVQTAEMKDGVAGAKKINDVEQAVEAQQKFMESPFKTWIIDKEGKIHHLSDFETTYEGTAKFSLDLTTVDLRLIGEKIEYKKGNIVIDAKNSNKSVTNMMTTGFWLCSNPITAIFGICVLGMSAVAAITTTLARGNKQKKLKNVELEKVTGEMQERAKTRCQENINSLVSKYAKLINLNKKKCSTEEFNQKLNELREQFIFEYHKAVGGLGLLEGGEIECPFDMSRKSKITKDNYLGFLACMKIRKEMEFGKQPHPDIDKIWKSFRETKFVSDDERLLKEVELLRQYGGRDDQVLAYQLEQHNLELFLKQENNARRARGERLLSLEDYKKVSNNRFNEGRLVWGGIKDKLEAFKQSDEYLGASRFERKKLLKAKQQELISKMNKIQVTTVEVPKRLDKKGQPVIDSYSRDAMAYMEEVLTMFGSGNTKIYAQAKNGKKKQVKKFSFGYYERMTAEQKEVNPPKPITENLARRHGGTFYRGLSRDLENVSKATKRLEEQHAELDAQIVERGEKVAKMLETSDYVSALMMSVVIASQDDVFKSDCGKIARNVDAVKRKTNIELSPSSLQDVVKGISGTISKYRRQQLRVAKVVAEKEVEHRREAEVTAIIEFAKGHTKAYQRYCASLNIPEGLQDALALKHSFCKSMMGSEKHGQSATLEYEMLKVKYHAKETIVAEVYCESKPDEYKQFIEQTNARSKGPQLSLDSEDARCLYYAYCMQTNPTEVKQARDEQGFVKILNNKIKQRVADRTLGKHEARGSTMKKSEETKTATEEVVGTTDKKDDSHTSGQGRDKGSRGRRVGVLRPINPKPLVSQ